ncbi:MAG: sensor histidine kinase [Endozoicomonas sp.]
MSFFVEYSERFLNADLEQIPVEIEKSVEQFREISGCGRCTLGRLKPDQRTVDYAFSATAPGIATLNLSDLAPFFYEKYITRVLKNQVIVLNPKKDMSTEELQYLGEVSSHIIVPLSVRGKVWGTMSASHFDYEKEWHGEAKFQTRIFGELAASTLERYQFMTDLTEQRGKLAHLSQRLLHNREEERRALARDLHDDFSQRLALLSIESRNLQYQLTDVQEGASDLATHLAEDIASLAKDIQALSRTLHPKILEDLGLVAAIRAEGRRLEALHGLEFVITCEAVTEPDRDAALHLFRIFQEAITNTVKHANATRVEVLLEERNRELSAVIKDDGVGIDSTAWLTESESLGLASMHERCEIIGAELSLSSSQPRGTCLKLTMPLEKKS